MAPDVCFGRCLCGSISFELHGSLRPVIVCHCRQCARWSGHVVAATAVPADAMRLLTGESDLVWYRSSPAAERGFCRTCGSNLFWKPASGGRISVLAGALEPPTGLKMVAHIFTADKSDYYEISDGVQCFAQSAGALAEVSLAAPSERAGPGKT